MIGLAGDESGRCARALTRTTPATGLATFLLSDERVGRSAGIRGISRDELAQIS
jgi:hypothetical protein